MEEFGGYGDEMFRFMITKFTKFTITWPLEGYSLCGSTSLIPQFF